MAHLFTNHDPRRLHALAGASVLLHFVYRLLLLAWCGDAFPDDGRGSAATHVSVALHAVLHATSFVPHVPRRRATSKPMIWPEFRVHNAIFSLRHVACTLVAVNASRLHGYDFALRVGIAFVAMAMADVTTARIGDASHRTTNAMPYPVHSPERDVANTKRFYAKAQFHATAWAVLGDPTTAWFPLLALEASPLLMTLVRKGILQARSYHVVYSASLWLAYPVLMLRGVRDAASLHPGLVVAGFVAHRLRVQCAMSKYAVWGVVFAMSHLYTLYGQAAMASYHVRAAPLVVGGGAYFFVQLTWLLRRRA